MALKSTGRNLSFDVLSRNGSLDEEEEAIFYRSNSDPIQSNHHNNDKPARRKRKKKKKNTTTTHSSIPESPANATVSNSFPHNSRSKNGETSGINGLEFSYSQTVLCPATTEVSDPEFQKLRGTAELRQRPVNGSAGGVVGETQMTSSRIEAEDKEDSGVEAGSVSKQRSEPNGNAVPKLQTAESLDWKRLMAEDPNCEPFFFFLYLFLSYNLCLILNSSSASVFKNNCSKTFPSDLFSVDKSPVKYFMEEMSNGNSLRSTTTLGNEKERERVYDTIFRLPWRCELVF